MYQHTFVLWVIYFGRLPLQANILNILAGLMIIREAIIREADGCPKERMTINPNENDRIAQSVEL